MKWITITTLIIPLIPISDTRDVLQRTKKIFLKILDQMNQNRGGSVTIKIPTYNIDQLQHESDIKQMSLNSRINHN